MPDPILFSWGPFTIRWYGVLIGLGMMLGIGGATRYAICRTQGDGTPPQGPE